MSRKHDIVFIVIDSARKDRVSAFDHTRETTPTFEEVASQATVYENAFVPAPWTLPSHCSMFTGKFPSEHGVVNGFTDRTLQLSSEFPTIPELLAGRGYATAGFSNNPWVGQLSGLNRGFDHFVEWDLEISQSGPPINNLLRDEIYSGLHTVIGRAAGQPHALLKRRFFTSNLIERAKRWISETNDRPSFTFMNLMEAHSPYYPPKAAFRALSLDPPGFIEPRTLNARLLAYIMGKSDLSATMRKRVMEFYDASLRYQDGKLNELMSFLHSEGCFDDALIVICADHGKTLGDYDREAIPPHYVRDININVPLLIKWPNRRQREREAAPVELIDLFDTIADIEDAPEPIAREEGALVEDYIPHTGRSATDTERWRVLADASHKFIRSETESEFVFARGTTETRIDGTDTEASDFRDRLVNRVNALDAPWDRTSEETVDDALSGTVEGQLQDLGYLS